MAVVFAGSLCMPGLQYLVRRIALTWQENHNSDTEADVIMPRSHPSQSAKREQR